MLSSRNMKKNHCKRLNLLNSLIPRGASDMLLSLNILLFSPLIHKMGAFFCFYFVCLFVFLECAVFCCFSSSAVTPNHVR